MYLRPHELRTLHKSQSHVTPLRVSEKSAVRILRAYYFLAFAAMGLYLPYLPTWLRSLGFVGWRMSLLVALLPICQLASPTLIGMLADRLALRGLMIAFCAASTATGLSLFAVCAGAISPLPFLIAFACMLSFAALRAPLIGLAEVLAMENAPDYGRLRLFGSLGFMVAALGGGAWVDPTHPFLLPSLVALIVWTVLALSFFLPRTSKLPPRPAWNDAQDLLRQPTYRRLLITMVFVFVGMSGYDLCATLRLRELGASGTTIGFFWALATLAEVVLLYWAKPLLHRIGSGRALTIACTISALRWLYLSQATSLQWILVLQPFHALSFGLMWVSAMGVLAREVQGRGTATAQGLFSSAVATGAATGFTLWGIVYDAKGSEAVFLGTAIASGLAALSALRLIRATRPLLQQVA